jgi:hypothetical protein
MISCLRTQQRETGNEGDAIESHIGICILFS